MAGQQESTTADSGGALDNVQPRSIVPLHVEVGCREVRGTAVTQVARYRQCLEKNLRHQYRAAQIQHDSSLVQIRNRACEPAKIPVTGSSNGCAICRRVLVN